MINTEIVWVTTACGEGGCIELADIGRAPDGTDWFRMRSNNLKTSMVAVTGAELRAFITQVKAGQFDELAGLEPDTTVADLLAELTELRQVIKDHAPDFVDLEPA
jgi:hypothetical protein